MADTVTVVGVIATEIKHTVTAQGLEVAQFRLASTHRRFDRPTQSWVDGETNWFGVAVFRQLAANAYRSLDKGQRVIVTGRLRVRDWSNGEKKGRDVEIVAEALGHDLAWGTTRYTRNVRDEEPGATSAAELLPAEPQPEPALPF